MTDHLKNGIEITCEGELCDNCKAEIKEEIEYLKELLFGDLNDDTKQLIRDIIHGYICELYGVEEYEEDEPEITVDEALEGSKGNFSDVYNSKVRVASLEDLLKALRGK